MKRDGEEGEEEKTILPKGVSKMVDGSMIRDTSEETLDARQ
jgi:hypothetical protein